MIENKKILSRISGLLYLVVIITGLFSLMYVPNLLFLWDNPLKTSENIIQHIGLFRLSIASSVICYIAFTVLVIFLYQIFRSVDYFYSKLMLILALISVPITFINLQNKYNILDIVKDNSSNPAQISEKIMELLNNYDNGILVLTVFWGLWLLPFGYLVYKSGFYPRVIGIFLMTGCFGYLINFFGYTLFEDYNTMGIAKYLKLLPALGEFSVCFWLLFIGIKSKKKSL